MLEIIAQLKEAMQTSHMTEAELAAKSGVSALTIQRILSGETSDPRIQTIQDLAVAMGLRVVIASPLAIEAAKRPDGIGTLLQHTIGTYEWVINEKRKQVKQWQIIAAGIFGLLLVFSVWYLLDVRFHGIGLFRE